MNNYYFKNNNLLQSILKIIIFFILALYPLYIFPSGSIQISHFLLLIFSILILAMIRISLDKYFYIFLFFLIYCCLVNVFYISYNIYVFEYYNLIYLKELFFLIFNFIIVITLVSFFDHQNFNHQKKFNVIFYGLATALVLILLSYFYQFFFGIDLNRFKSFFNNPNQLGYFSLCTFSLIYLLYRNLYISYFLMISVTIFCILLSILTLSKATFLTLFLCALFVIKPRNYKYSKIIMLIFFLLIVFFITFFYLEILDTNFFNRLINTLNETDSSLESRGYYVFLEANLLEAIFGMSLNKIYEIKKYEIHSTFMMILTSYGLIGLLIFSLLMLCWVLDIKKSFGLNGVICICAPPLLYGLTHNGIRFSMFWILFAISIAFSLESNKLKNLKEHRKV